MKLLTIGNVVRRKRVHLCARACALLEQEGWAQPLSWKVIGTGDLLDEVKRIAPKSMHFMPRVELLTPHYQEADIFVLPSYDEGFGMVYVEAIMCGCPVVATRGEGGTEIVEGTGGGILIDVPASEDAAARNIVAAVRQITERRSSYINESVMSAARRLVDPAGIREEWNQLIVKCGGNPLRTEPTGW
jgi:glycosyltransferase involved in cell wall biosynthesis